MTPPNIEPNGNFETLSVLVIDDDDMIIRIIVHILNEMGFSSIETTSSPETGLALILEGESMGNGFDLVLCDWVMPGKTGIEILREVRAANYSTPFIMLTANVTKDAVQEAAKLGVDAYLGKPFTIDQVQRKVKSVLLHTH